MRRLTLVAALLLLLLAALPTVAQDDDAGDTPEATPEPTIDCEIDLTRAAALLVEAQDEAGAGDVEAALEAVAQVQAEIDRVLEECGQPAVTDPAEYVVTLRPISPENDLFTFSFPASWQSLEFDAFDSTRATIYTASDVLLLFDPLERGLISGEQTVRVFVGTGPDIFTDDDPDAEAVAYTVDDVIATVRDTLVDGMGYNVEGTSEVIVEGREAVRIDHRGNGTEGVTLVMPLGGDFYAAIQGLASPGERDDLLPILFAATRTLQLNAAATQPPAEDDGMVELPQVYAFPGVFFTFSYPENWLIEDLSNLDDVCGQVLAATGPQALDRLRVAPLQRFQPGEQGVRIIAGDAPYINESLEADIDFATFVADYRENFLPNLGLEITAEMETTINNQPAVILDFAGPTGTGRWVAIDLATEGLFAVAEGFAAADEFEAFLPVFMAMTETIQCAANPDTGR